MQQHVPTGPRGRRVEQHHQLQRRHCKMQHLMSTQHMPRAGIPGRLGFFGLASRWPCSADFFHRHIKHRKDGTPWCGCRGRRYCLNGRLGEAVQSMPQVLGQCLQRHPAAKKPMFPCDEIKQHLVFEVSGDSRSAAGGSLPQRQVAMAAAVAAAKAAREEAVAQVRSESSPVVAKERTHGR